MHILGVSSGLDKTPAPPYYLKSTIFQEHQSVEREDVGSKQSWMINQVLWFFKIPVIASCNGIQIPESRICFLLWNLESWNFFLWESRIQYVESKLNRVKSRTQDCLGFPYNGVMVRLGWQWFKTLFQFRWSHYWVVRLCCWPRLYSSDFISQC